MCCADVTNEWSHTCTYSYVFKDCTETNLVYKFCSLKSAAILGKAIFRVIKVCMCNASVPNFTSRLARDAVRVKTQEDVLFENKQSSLKNQGRVRI